MHDMRIAATLLPVHSEFAHTGLAGAAEEDGWSVRLVGGSSLVHFRRMQRAPREPVRGSHLEFVDFQLRRYGHVGSGEVRRFFSTSQVRAVRALREYFGHAPRNGLYDASRRSYFATKAFRSLYDGNRPLRHLDEVLIARGGDPGLLERQRALVRSPVSAVELSADASFDLLNIAATSTRAELTYQAESSSQPQTLEVSPHAFGYDGFQWQFRAFCFDDGRFRSFDLARVLGVEKVDGPPVDSADDVAWHRTIKLVLCADPTLTDLQRKGVQNVWGMAPNQVVLHCRQLFLPNTLEVLGLPPSLSQNVSDGRGIEVLNVGEIQQSLNEHA